MGDDDGVVGWSVTLELFVVSQTIDLFSHQACDDDQGQQNNKKTCD